MLDIFMGICLYITVLAIENLINEDFFILDVAENQITEKSETECGYFLRHIVLKLILPPVTLR